MKKILSVLLALVFLLPAAASAAPEQDFVGTWYMMTDSRPVGSDIWLLMEFIMYSDGTASIIYEGTAEKMAEMPHYYTGTWKWNEEESAVYFIDSIGSVVPLYYADGDMYLKTNGIYIKLTKAEPLAAQDYVLYLPD